VTPNHEQSKTRRRPPHPRAQAGARNRHDPDLLAVNRNTVAPLSARQAAAAPLPVSISVLCAASVSPSGEPLHAITSTTSGLRTAPARAWIPALGPHHHGLCAPSLRTTTLPPSRNHVGELPLPHSRPRCRPSSAQPCPRRDPDLLCFGLHRRTHRTSGEPLHSFAHGARTLTCRAAPALPGRRPIVAHDRASPPCSRRTA
jgi:hypothetical protein